MGLFQKKPDVSSSAPLYTVGNQRSVLIIGLGNPGKEHEATRHNIGFLALDDFAAKNDFPAWTNKKDLKATLTYRNLGDTRVILLKPQTFMNNSGLAAKNIQAFYKIPNSSTLAIYDELALKFGQLRARVGGSDAGHNGMKSLIQHIGEDFARLRLGISSDHSDEKEASAFVLSKFSKEEAAKLPAILNEAGVMLTEYIFSGSLPHETRAVA
jgi:peptidyl-tRNA hydrolase, PTH1 family